jgi:hypothetical protein
MIADEFRKQAERCRAHAESATKNADRAFWLLLAQNWQTMAEEAEQVSPVGSPVS